MLRETQKIISENFVKDTAITGVTCYRHNQQGYWQLIIIKDYNSVEIIQGSKYFKLVTSNDKAFASYVNTLYLKFYFKMSKILNLKKFKPKRMKAEGIATLLEIYKSYEEGFELSLKQVMNYYKLQKIKNDFE